MSSVLTDCAAVYETASGINVNSMQRKKINQSKSRTLEIDGAVRGRDRQLARTPARCATDSCSARRRMHKTLPVNSSFSQLASLQLGPFQPVQPFRRLQKDSELLLYSEDY